MKTLRLAEVLLPLLAARWAPWAIEPRLAADRGANERPPATARGEAIWRDRRERRAPYDDVQ